MSTIIVYGRTGLIADLSLLPVFVYTFCDTLLPAPAFSVSFDLYHVRY